MRPRVRVRGSRPSSSQLWVVGVYAAAVRTSFVAASCGACTTGEPGRRRRCVLGGKGGRGWRQSGLIRTTPRMRRPRVRNRNPKASEGGNLHTWAATTRHNAHLDRGGLAPHAERRRRRGIQPEEHPRPGRVKLEIAPPCTGVGMSTRRAYLPTDRLAAAGMDLGQRR